MRYTSFVVLAIAAAPFAVVAQTSNANAQFAGPGLVIYTVGQNYGANAGNNTMYNGTNSAYFSLAWPNGAQGSDLTLSGQLPSGLSFQSVTASGANTADAIFGTPAVGTEGTYNLTLNGTVNGTAYTYPVTLVVEPQTVAMTTLPSGMTGNWFGGSSQSGHGFSIEMLPNSQMLAQWYTFLPIGSNGIGANGTGQAWINAIGTVTGNTATLQGYQMAGTGALFPPNFDQNNVQAQQWGTLTFTFYDCNYGLVSWDTSGNSTGNGAPDYGSGSMAIQRLTMPEGLTCTTQ